MFQYFLKVVSTQFRTYDGKIVRFSRTILRKHSCDSNLQVNTHQYSATSFERDLVEGDQGNTAEGIHVQHGTSGVPGDTLLIIYVAPVISHIPD